LLLILLVYGCGILTTLSCGVCCEALQGGEARSERRAAQPTQVDLRSSPCSVLLRLLSLLYCVIVLSVCLLSAAPSCLAPTARSSSQEADTPLIRTVQARMRACGRRCSTCVHREASTICFPPRASSSCLKRSCCACTHARSSCFSACSLSTCATLVAACCASRVEATACFCSRAATLIVVSSESCFSRLLWLLFAPSSWARRVLRTGGAVSERLVSW
jgi:hypothetical protein